MRCFLREEWPWASQTRPCLVSELFPQPPWFGRYSSRPCSLWLGPPENTMQRYMTVHVTCQNHVSYMTFNISDMHFDMSEHFEHVVCHATIHVIYHVVLPMKMCLHHNFSTTEPIWMILLSTESSWLSYLKYTRFRVGYSNKFFQMSDKLLTQAREWLHKKVKKSLRK